MEHFTEVRADAYYVLNSAPGFGMPAIEDLRQRGYRGAILPESHRQAPAFQDWDILTSGLASLILNLPEDLRTYIRETELIDDGTQHE